MLVNDLYHSFREICPQSIISKDHFSELYALNSSCSQSNQTKSDLNVLCRTKLGLTEKIMVPIRTQVTIAQTLIVAQRKHYRPLSIVIIQHTFFLSEDFVRQGSEPPLGRAEQKIPVLCVLYAGSITCAQPD